EPKQGAFSVTPLIIQSGELQTAREFDVAQSLRDGWAPIPEVTWSGESVTLKISAVDTTEAVTDVLYTVMNSGNDSWNGSLVLAVRPLQVNPPWQRGGFSPIHDALWENQLGLLTISG